MNIKYLFLFFLFNFIFFVPAHANSDFCGNLSMNKFIKLTDLGPGKRVRGYACFVVQDSSEYQKVVTLKHANNSGDWNLLVGTNFDTETKKMHGIISHSNNQGVVDEIVWLPGKSHQKYVVVVYPTSSTPSKACLIQHQFDVEEIAAQAFFEATAQSALKWLLSNENDTKEQSNQKSRAIAGGMSIIKRNNLASVGYDMLLSEISLQLSNAFGGGSWLTTFGVNYFGGFLEQSGRYLFDTNMSCSEKSNLSSNMNTNPSSSKSNSGHEFYFKNSCSKPLNLILRYKKPSGTWVTDGWWSFDANEKSFLSVDKARIRSNNSIFYYYAHIPGRSYSWSGDENRLFQEKTYPMRKAELSKDKDGDWVLELNCDNLN